MHDRLAEIARRDCYRNIEHLLSTPAKPFQPSIPLGEIAQRCIDAANLRREVLAPLLWKLGATGSLSEMVRQAKEAFLRGAGYRHRDERTLRRWIQAAIKNDGAREDWNRLEIYLVLLQGRMVG